MKYLTDVVFVSKQFWIYEERERKVIEIMDRENLNDNERSDMVDLEEENIIGKIYSSQK